MTEQILKIGDTFNAYLVKEYKGRLVVGAPFTFVNQNRGVENATDVNNQKRIFNKEDFEFVIIHRK